MIKKIDVISYRKLKDIALEFGPGVNVISGTNGTCKTSLLHIVSNSFQAVTKQCSWLSDDSCLSVLNRINGSLNPKIESLTKGDKVNNDPSNGQSGTIFSVDYYDNLQLTFRKHNSKVTNRYAVKPFYPKGSNDSLPFSFIVYLGLSRLFPFGEVIDESIVTNIKKYLPDPYQDLIKEIYNDFTGISISSFTHQKVGEIKVRADFDSNNPGIDSNTISAGEDNLYIIISALVSLKYYFECINSERSIESILLIDEFDATLHPSIQLKLLDLFIRYADQYKIQIIITTHSLYTIEMAIKKKQHIIYLIDSVDHVTPMQNPDIYKIKMFLHNKTNSDLYAESKIPILTEDNEARIFLNILFDHIEKKVSAFSSLRRFFHLTDTKIGADNLLTLFNDSYLIKSTLRSICLLDGDHQNARDPDKHIICLPGLDSPEKVIMDYSMNLSNTRDPFWDDNYVLDTGMGRLYFNTEIKPKIEEIANKLNSLKTAGESTHGVERNMRKKVFNKFEAFFNLTFKHWVNNPENKRSIIKFFNDLKIMFKKVSPFHSINPGLWNFDYEEDVIE